MPLKALARFVALAALSVALYSFSMQWGFLRTGWTLATDFDLVLHTSEPSVRGFGPVGADGNLIPMTASYRPGWWVTLLFLAALATTFGGFVLQLAKVARGALFCALAGFTAAALGMLALRARIDEIARIDEVPLPQLMHGGGVQQGYFVALFAIAVAAFAAWLASKPSASTDKGPAH